MNPAMTMILDKAIKSRRMKPKKKGKGNAVDKQAKGKGKIVSSTGQNADNE